MYELADWGQPVAPDWEHPRERLDARLPADLIRVLRRMARADGVSVSVLVHRLLSDAIGLQENADLAEPVRSAFD
ncbi:MAG: hypothetical protein Q8Q29_02990 [Actinomycetota bacterium]|nr:hypothetical protein [Actinomycetota bacterium]